jgi:hypothetical protein
MKTWLGWLTASLLLMIVASYAWTHRHFTPAAVAEPAPQPEATYAEAQEAQKMIVVTGPMADYVLHQKPSDVETIQPVSHKVSELDRVGESPVGTSSSILDKTFRVNGVVDLPFEIPAHAASPTLHGKYRSFVQQGGTSGITSTSDASADVEFLLLNQQQFDDFVNGRPADALFSADSAHDGEVNFTLPPTMTQATWFYLVFRNGSQTKDKNKKVVQADFRVDF